MSPLLLFFTSWAVGFSGAASPGPVSTFCLTEGARRGFWAGPRITLGHALIELGMVLLLALGLGPILAQPLITACIALFGGGFLLWMGWDLATGAWRRKLTLDLDARAEPKGITRLGSVPAGAVISVLNPYWFLWWATIGASYVITALTFGVVGLLAFYLGHILADLTWNSLLTFIASSGRRVLSPEFYRWLLIAFGLFLIGFSFYFLFTGIGFLVNLR
ncbi:MAG: LysE family transporter [Anaerolineae bacterium]